MKFFKKNVLKNQKGQGVMEYIIIASLVGIVCIATVKKFGETVSGRIENMKEALSRENLSVPTGRNN